MKTLLSFLRYMNSYTALLQQQHITFIQSGYLHEKRVARFGELETLSEHIGKDLFDVPCGPGPDLKTI